MTSAKEKIKIGEGEYEVSWEMTILERVAREALVEDSHLLKNRKEGLKKAMQLNIVRMQILPKINLSFPCNHD